MKIAAKEFKGYQYRNIKHLKKALLDADAPRDIIDHVVQSWCKCKLIVSLYPETHRFLRWLFRENLLLKNQEKYHDILEYCRSNDWMFLKDASGKRFFQQRSCDPFEMRIAEELYELEPPLWPSELLFPLYTIKKESKIQLAMEEPDFDANLMMFRRNVARFLMKCNLKSLFIPPAQVLMKNSTAKYNDGGEVREDHERPQNSWTSCFKFQEFMTKPFTPREVWLPGKLLKLNNSFWMIIGRQFLNKTEIYPSTDPEELWNNIRSHDLFGVSGASETHVDPYGANVTPHFGMFDVTGFGIQYIRVLLKVVIEEISKFYPHEDLKEQADIAIRWLDNVSVQMPDGTFIYPPRGIGLGYYEDLKTIGVLAILGKFNPISLYGDQGLLRGDVTREAVETLRYFGFRLKPTKEDYFRDAVQWSGLTMTKEEYWRAKSKITPLIGSFFQQEHWERKKALYSYYTESEDYVEKERWIAFHYEKIFGYEFQRSDSMWNFLNGGLCYETPRMSGYVQGWKAERLHHPGVRFDDLNYQESNLLTSVTKTSARAFQKKRNELFRSAPVMDTAVVDYVYPRLEMNKKKNIHLTREGASLPMWADLSLLTQYGMTTGKITSGLRGEDIYKAVLYQKFAPDPFKARAEGGYKILTNYHSERGPSEEHLALAKILQEAEFFESRLAKRFDVKLGVKDLWDSHYLLYDYLLEHGKITVMPPPGTKRRPSVLSEISASDRRRLRKVPRKESYRPKSPELNIFNQVGRDGPHTGSVSHASVHFSDVSLSQAEESAPEESIEEDYLYEGVSLEDFIE